MTPYLDLIWVGALALLVMVVAAAIVEAIGERRLARWLRLGDDE